jgi:hypothetical protein
MATKKQIANVAKLQADVNKQIKALKESVSAVEKTNVSTPAPGSQAYIDKLRTDRETETNRRLGPKPDEKPGFQVQRVGDEWRYISTSTGVTKQPIQLPQGDDDSQAKATRYASDQAAAIEKARIQSERVSAYALLESEFTKYGLGELAKTVKKLILDGASSSEMTIKLRNTPEYQVRFAGNTQRLKEGKNVYDEATYLALENSMQQAFTAYGVSNLLGDSRDKQQAKLATFIGGDISPTEVKNRIQLAVEEVSNRPDILSAFQEYYPQVSSNDLVSYFLDPKETTTRLTTKIKASQIGAAAMRQGFVSNVLNSEELAALGVTEEQAVVGYRNVAAVLPEAEKLSAIENTGYSASEAEGAYLRNLESEQRKLRKLAERESARFGGRSGVNQTSLKDVKSAGQF